MVAVSISLILQINRKAERSQSDAKPWQKCYTQAQNHFADAHKMAPQSEGIEPFFIQISRLKNSHHAASNRSPGSAARLRRNTYAAAAQKS